MDEIAEINPNVFLIFTGGDPLLGRDIWDRRRHKARSACRVDSERDNMS